MPARTFFRSLDNLGSWSSLLCVLHCLLTPVLLSMSAVTVHFLPSEEGTHRALAVVVAALGIIAICRGFRRHRRRRVIFLAGIGLASIWAAALWGERFGSHAAEVLVTLCGSVCMIAAHRLNHTFCSDCSCSSK